MRRLLKEKFQNVSKKFHNFSHWNIWRFQRAATQHSTYDVVKNQPPSASFNPFVLCNDGSTGTAMSRQSFLINSVDTEN